MASAGSSIHDPTHGPTMGARRDRLNQLLPVTGDASYSDLLAEAQRQARELELLDRARTALAKELDLASLLRRVVEAVVDGFGFAQVSIYDLQGDHLHLQHQVGYDSLLERMSITTGIAGRVARTGQPVLVEDVADDPDYLGVRADVASEICVPYFDQGSVAGIINIESTLDLPLSAADLKLMIALAGHLSIAVERARLYSEAREREQMYRTLVDTSPDAILLTDMEGTILLANPQAALQHGFASPDELVGKLGNILHAPEAGEKVAALGVQLRLHGAAQSEVQMMRADGARFLSEVRLSLLKNATGEPHGVLAVSRDITDRQLAQDALTISEERFRGMFESSAAAQAAVALDGRYLEVNEAMCRLAGYSQAQLMQLTFQSLTHPDDLAASLPQWRRLLSGAVDHYQMEMRHVRNDGASVPTLITVSLVRNAEGAPAYALSLVQDLSERERAVEAQRESEAKSRFLATMSHELRTPLNSVLGFAQLLSHPGFGPLTEKQRRYVDNILHSGRHLLDLITEILDLAKIQSGQMDLDMEPIVLAGLIEDAATQMRPLALRKKLRLRTRVDPDQQVTADRRRLYQVLLNLLTNAIKFTPEGGTIRVSTRACPSRVEIRVADTGIGIARERIEFVFQEFTQVDSGTRRHQEGTGLGLALSRRLVEHMGGTLEVESEVGKGSTFTVALGDPAAGTALESMRTVEA